ncbi:MAG: prefoldin subunit alpha [Candidatus Ranarchaeia archaeon]
MADKAAQANQEKINQLAYEMRAREEQVKSINDNLRLMSMQIEEVTKTVETIKHIGTLKKGNVFFVPIGAGVFIKVGMLEVSEILTDLGASMLAERTPEEVIKYLNENKVKIEGARNNLEQQLNSSVARIQEVQKELEAMLQARSGA